jgi:hypothetical protein
MSAHCESGTPGQIGVDVAVAAPITTPYAREELTVPFVTPTTKAKVPEAVGVPEMVAVDEPAVAVRFSPVGSVPEATLHVKGPVAVPVAFRDAAYGTVVVPLGSESGRMLMVEVEPPPPPPQSSVQTGVATVMVEDDVLPGF